MYIALKNMCCDFMALPISKCQHVTFMYLHLESKYNKKTVSNNSPDA